MDPLAWVDDELQRLSEADLLRELPLPVRAAGARVERDGQTLISFASNDYLGLAADERLAEAAASVCRSQGVGRGASPLVCGRGEIHVQLEARLAVFFAVQAVLLFPTSFAANAGIIPALVDQGDAIYGDAKNHASIIDGCRLSRAERHIYPHLDVVALERMLQEAGRYRRRLIVTDALFSMDGDLAPLVELADLAERYDAMLMVDEAHAVGVFGARGRGVAEQLGVEQRVAIRVGTFGKALGSAGGFVFGRQSLIRWLSNRARTYVFSTAHPASLSAAALTALDIVEENPGRGAKLLEKAAVFRQRLRDQDWDPGASASQIVPLRVGTPARAMQFSEQLAERGLWVPGIRPPSVPAHESLLRIGLSSEHTEEILDALLEGLASVRASLA